MPRDSWTYLRRAEAELAGLDAAWTCDDDSAVRSLARVQVYATLALAQATREQTIALRPITMR